MLYTSGTTGKPKGAMITHANIATQSALLREAWGFRETDLLLHALPLHHLHGLGISLLTALLSGAGVRMLDRFEAQLVWDGMADASVFMAVPTMYQKLFDTYDAAMPEARARWEANARSLRLATSGSAALPVRLSERWRAITGRHPLERFGMTEIGVGMSNPLEGERKPGSVGTPLPSVDLRIVDEAGSDVREGEAGELWIRGPSVFAGYFGKEEATRAAFTDGWFKTGDVGTRDASGYVRLLGRRSVDILKSGGYKLSALEIEDALRENDAIAEIAVVGVADETWGELVVAAVVPRSGRAADVEEQRLRAWAKERLAPYKVPRRVIVCESLPRNAVGKVIKPELAKNLADKLK
jgi:malonyl-CoA/methylmalonyl-CoA synthetase